MLKYLTVIAFVALSFPLSAQDGGQLLDDVASELEAAPEAFANGKMIVLSESKGFRHGVAKRGKDGKPALVETCMTAVGKAMKMQVLCTQDVADLTPGALSDTDIVVMYTTGELPFTEKQYDAFEQWIRDGGALLGIHPATDTLKKHDKFPKLIGGVFDGHPWNANTDIVLKVQDLKHPAVAGFHMLGDDALAFKEEIYQFKQFDAENVRVLMSLDMVKTKKPKKPYHVPVVWCKQVGKGKVLYTSLGHRKDVWANATFATHLFGSIDWLLGSKEGSAEPNPQVHAYENALNKAHVEGKPLPNREDFVKDTPLSVADVTPHSNGLTLHLSAPLAEDVVLPAEDPRVYDVDTFGGDDGPGQVMLTVKSASVADDRKSIFLETDATPMPGPNTVLFHGPLRDEHGNLLDLRMHEFFIKNMGRTDGKTRKRSEPKTNVLNDDEKAAGFELLFDGKSLEHFRNFKRDDVSDGWQAVDGTLARVGKAGDIMTRDKYGDFELRLDWKISKGGNSGIIYLVSEDGGATWHSGPEMQILDDKGKVVTKHSAGSNYALHAPPPHTAWPAGMWNSVRLIKRGDHVEHWQNGVKVVEYELGSNAWNKLVEGSKFRKYKLYGKADKGHIALQDHGNAVWFRNIRIRELGAGD